MTLYETIILIFYALFGLVIGSFGNVCICRLPEGQSVVKPASRCPRCNGAIRWYDNIPLFSFLMLKGKCRDCGEKISPQYPLVELLTALLFVGCYLAFGLSVYSVCAALFCAALLFLSVTDMQCLIIPDPYHVVILVLAVVCVFVPSPALWYDRLIGFVGGGGILYLIAVLSEKILKKEGMGGGDIKLLAVSGAFLGWQLMLLGLFLGSIVGAVIGIAAMASKRAEGLAAKIPFAPSLSMGMAISLFFGWQIIDWYLYTFVFVY